MGLINLYNVFRSSVCFFLIFTISGSVWAGWGEGKLLFANQWGAEETQFNIDASAGYPYEELPGGFDVSPLGNIILNDKVNRRYRLFNSSGGFVRNLSLQEPANKWSNDPVFVGENIFISADKYYFYDFLGNLLAKVKIPAGKSGSLISFNNDIYVERKQSTLTWFKYSNSGNLLASYAAKPVEIGEITESAFVFNGNKHYRTIVYFNNERWVLNQKSGLCEDYLFDAAGFLYCRSISGSETVTKFNRCGKPISTFVKPSDKYISHTFDQPGIDPYVEVEYEYSGLVLDDNGNIYATKRSPENYSLIKWAWQNSPSDKNEGPDAPINVTLTALSASVVDITWEGSLQDPGCVTGYQVLRSNTPGGATTVVANPKWAYRAALDTSVEAGKTYYYTVKALSAIGDSQPSEEVSITLAP